MMAGLITFLVILIITEGDLRGKGKSVPMMCRCHDYYIIFVTRKTPTKKINTDNKNLTIRTISV